LKHFAVGAQGEICRVDDAAPLFPVGADAVSICRHFETVADRKRRAGFRDHFLGFFERIDGQGDDVGVLGFEFFQMSLIVGDLPHAVGSPDAAVVDDYRVFPLQIGGKSECPAVG